MLIRSQNKEILVNFDCINVFYFLEMGNGRYSVYSEGGEFSNVLGTYCGKEKTIKVIDMIQDAYEKYEYEKVFKTGLRLFETFQMPEDDEVRE